MPSASTPDHARQGQQRHGVVEGDRVERHRLEQRAGARLGALRRVLGQHLGDVGAVAAVLGHDRQPGLRVLAERDLLAGRVGEQLRAPSPSSARRAAGRRARWPAWRTACRRRRGPRGRGRSGRPAARSRSRVRRSGRSPAPWRRCRRDRSTSGCRPAHPVGAVVELRQLGVAVLVAAGDLVEDVLHLRGELVGDEAGEVLLQQPDHRERQPGRHQRGALLVDVAAVEDRADDRGVRRRSADLALLELLDQRRLGVAGRRLGLVAGGAERGGGERVALGQRRAAASASSSRRFELSSGVLDVGLEEAVEGDRAAARGEDDVLAGRTAAPPSRTVTELPTASFICEATVRIQISS